MTPSRDASRRPAGPPSATDWRWLPVVLLVAALALRLAGATNQSLWYDEGTSAALATRALRDIMTAAANDIHPPLYYVLLSAWTQLVGTSVFAMRALSAMLGTVLVALAFALGRRLWGLPAATAAALLAASSPLLVWYGQEVRMYMLGATLSAALLWVALELATRRRPHRAWPAAVVLAAASIYTHYFVGASAIAASSAALLAWLALSPAVTRAQRARRLTAWLAAIAVAALLFAPWLQHAWPAARDWPSVGPDLSPTQMLAATAEAYALGPRVPPAAAAGLAAVLLLPLLAVVTGLTPGRRRATLAATAHAVTPLLLLVVAAMLRSAWDPKLLIAGAPSFELLAGAGAATLWRRRGVVRLPARARTLLPLAAALVLLAGAAVPRLRTLAAVWTDPAYQRDDYRAVAETIDRRAGPADAVVLTAPTQIEVFELYDRRRHPTYPLPQGRRPDPEETRAHLEAIAGRHRDLYGVLWAASEADPEGVVEGWLNRNRFKAYDSWFGNVRLAMWAAAREPMVARHRPGTDSEPGVPVSFGDDEILLAHVAAGRTLIPGDVLTLEAWWLSGPSGPPRADYVVFAHLVDAEGDIVAQRDMAPVGGTARTSTWTPGGPGGSDRERPEHAVRLPADVNAHRDLIGLAVPEDLAGGRYRLLLGLYDPATGIRLPVAPPVVGHGEATGPSDAVLVGHFSVGGDGR